jgi:hypothetical protein
MPGTTLGDFASWHRFYLDVKPSHVWVDVDRLAYPCIILWHAAII